MQEWTGRALGGAHTSATSCLIYENISGQIHVWNTMLHSTTTSFLALSLNGEESLKKISSSLIRIQIFTKIESVRPCRTPNLPTKFHPNPSNFFEMCYVSVQPDLSMVKNHWKHYQIWIRIFTKIESILPCHTSNVSTKFHLNPSNFFLRHLVHRDRQTDRKWWNHKFLHLRWRRWRMNQGWQRTEIHGQSKL